MIDVSDNTSAQQPCLPYFQAALWRKLGNVSGNLTKRLSPGTQACPTSRRTAPNVCHPVNRQNAGMHPKTWNLTNCRPPGCTPPDQKRSKVHPDTGVHPILSSAWKAAKQVATGSTWARMKWEGQRKFCPGIGGAGAKEKFELGQRSNWKEGLTFFAKRNQRAYTAGGVLISVSCASASVI